LERSGKIVSLDQYVIALALGTVSDWSSWIPKAFKMNVNISTAGISSQKLVSQLETKFSQQPSPVQMLCLETTEESLA